MSNPDPTKPGNKVALINVPLVLVLVLLLAAFFSTTQTGGPPRYWWFVLSAFAGFGPTAFFNWPLTDQEAQKSEGSKALRRILWAVGITSTMVAAFSEYRGGPGMALFPWVGGGVALAIICRVGFDVRRNPTSHNLWPIEVLLFFFLGLIPALPAFLLAEWVFRTFV